MLSLVVVFHGTGQQNDQGVSGPNDVVVIIDTSSSMSGSFRRIQDYVTGPLLKEFLRIGDTFHLISFSDTPRTEIARRVEGVGDVETIIGRLFLMYPLGAYSDITGALDYTERYITSLPQTRPKKVIFISDGDQRLRSGIPESGADATALQTRITETSARLSRQGVSFRFVRIPDDLSASPVTPSAARPEITPPPPAAGTSVQTTPGTGAATLSPQTAQPPAPTTVTSGPGAAQTGGVASQTPAPSPETVEPVNPQTSNTQTVPPVLSGTIIPASPAPDSALVETAESATPTPQDAGSPPATTSIPAAGNAQVPAQKAGASAPTAARPQKAAGSSQGFTFSLPLLLLIGIALGVILFALLIFFLVTKRIHNAPNRAMTYMGGRTIPQDISVVQNAEFLSHYKANQRRGSKGIDTPSKVYREQDTAELIVNGMLMLSLHVEDQNASIGRRNIHAVKAGTSFTVGGGNSDFLIFLVPMPPHIAEVHFDGRRCTFVPRKPQFFPDLGSQSLPDCIGKPIRVISEKKYELVIQIERYEDPLLAMNQLLNSIQVPVAERK